MYSKLSKRSRAGFSLIELIVVIAIIGILVMLAAPRFLGYTEKARIARIQNDVKVVEGKMLEQYINENYVFSVGDSGKTSDELRIKVEERKLYDTSGLVKLETGIDEGPYKLVEDSIRKEARTKLKGEFYANAKGKVYYEDTKSSKPSKPDGEKEPELELGVNGCPLPGFKGYMPVSITEEMRENAEIIEMPDESGGMISLSIWDFIEMLKSDGTMQNITFYNKNEVNYIYLTRINNEDVNEESILFFKLEDLFSGMATMQALAMGEEPILPEDSAYIYVKVTHTNGTLISEYEYGSLEIPKYLATYDGDNIQECIKNPKVPDASDSIIEENLTCNLDNIENYTGSDFEYIGNEDGGITIIGYNGPKEWADIVIPGKIDNKPVTQIGDGESSLSYFMTRSNVRIPCTVEKINDNAFYNSEITGLTFEPMSNLKVIGDSAFSANSGLRQYSLGYVEIPNSVIEIEGSAFWGAAISGLTLGENIKTIGDNAFSVNRLNHVEIPSSVRTIGDHAFSGNNIETLIIHDGLESIGEGAFDGDDSIAGLGGNATSKLKELMLPDSLIHIGDEAFINNELTKVIFGRNLKTIGARAFQDTFRDSNKIEGELILPEGLETIGYGAFQGNKITSVKIPNSVTVIEGYIFGNNEISDLIIGDKVTSIGEFAFRNNKISGELKLPNTLKIIEEDAFKNNNISSIVLPNNELLKIGTSAFNANNLPQGKAFISDEYRNGVASSRLTSYGGASKEDVTIPAHITILGEGAFDGTEIISLIVPNTVIEIEEDSIGYYMVKINKMTLPSNITIGAYNGSRTFHEYYNSNGKQGGTYKLINDNWELEN